MTSPMVATNGRATIMAALSALSEERRRRFRKLIGVSVLMHLAAFGLALWAPRPDRAPTLPAVVRVDLVAALPGNPAPPAPAARPVPPKPKTVVLPEKPKPVPVPKPKPKPEVKAKPKPKPEPKPAKPEPKAAPEPPQQSYSDVLAELRAEEASVSPAPAAGAGAAASARGPGVLVSPEVMAWMRRAKVHVTRAWVLAPGFRDQALQTEVTVRLGADGKVLTTRITRRSGNPWFDESVERALAKASPLPAPPEAREWSFLFTPQDVF